MSPRTFVHLSALLLMTAAVPNLLIPTASADHGGHHEDCPCSGVVVPGCDYGDPDEYGDCTNCGIGGQGYYCYYVPPAECDDADCYCTQNPTADGCVCDDSGCEYSTCADRPEECDGFPCGGGTEGYSPYCDPQGCRENCGDLCLLGNICFETISDTAPPVGSVSEWVAIVQDMAESGEENGPAPLLP